MRKYKLSLARDVITWMNSVGLPHVFTQDWKQQQAGEENRQLQSTSDHNLSKKHLPVKEY